MTVGSVGYSTERVYDFSSLTYDGWPPVTGTRTAFGSRLFDLLPDYVRDADDGTLRSWLTAVGDANAPVEAQQEPPAQPQPATGGILDTLGGIGGTLGDMLGGTTGPRGGRREGVIEAAAKSAARGVAGTIGREIGKQILRGVLGSILGGSRR